MAAVVRVKRRFEEEPLEAFILSCKRRKICHDDQQSGSEDPKLSSTILKFAGTIKEDENVLTHLKKYQIPDIQNLKDQFKKRSVNLSDKLRAEKQELSKINRYKIVNCFRSESVPDSSSVEDSDNSKSEYTIFDVETDTNDDSKTENQQESTNDLKYVYDLYYTSSDDFGDAEIEDYISIYPLSNTLMMGSKRDNGLDEPDSNDDSEDSNAENNWRNDYPDESDLESVTEEDMVEAVKNIDISEDLLSSDDGEEGFVYSIDSEGAGFEEDIDESDVFRYGERYARFKAKYKKEVEGSGLDHDFYYGDIDENEYYY